MKLTSEEQAALDYIAEPQLETATEVADDAPEAIELPWPDRLPLAFMYFMGVADEIDRIMDRYDDRTPTEAEKNKFENMLKPALGVD